MNLNLPNSLTIFRIFVIPIMVYLFLLGGDTNRMFTSILFLVAIITDYLDGMVARTMNQQTKFGEFLDPIADKLLVIIILLLLITENNQINFILPAIIIVIREFLVVAIRQRLAELGNKNVLKVAYISKIKTASQMISLLFLLYKEPIFNIDTYYLGVLFLQLASALTLISFIYYVKKTWNDII
ncbi:MAG: CDP-diacylglycerol--glycerol-3-phosphate 3-phosphatidyltransferase [Gammaproteobacteria bacterium]|nr:CDP-diacylglycerol--glycerol-3-phosphate 3-phosphatidyltransferase [Gammaproteobacteria bacterium]